jgi:hypothetical protein
MNSETKVASLEKGILHNAGNGSGTGHQQSSYGRDTEI